MNESLRLHLRRQERLEKLGRLWEKYVDKALACVDCGDMDGYVRHKDHADGILQAISNLIEHWYGRLDVEQNCCGSKGENTNRVQGLLRIAQDNLGKGGSISAVKKAIRDALGLLE